MQASILRPGTEPRGPARPKGTDGRGKQRWYHWYGWTMVVGRKVVAIMVALVAMTICCCYGLLVVVNVVMRRKCKTEVRIEVDRQKSLIPLLLKL